MNKESSIKQLKRIKQDMIHADDVNALDYAIRYMECKELEQEPFKPMVEIDLYSVIKQKYIEREVLDKIRAEIDRQQKWLLQAGYSACNVDIALDAIKAVVAESEVKE